MSVNVFEFGQKDKTLLYCNGICANFDDDMQRGDFKNQTEFLTSIFPNRKIVAFNNPTGLEEFFTNDTVQAQRIEDIAAQFRTVIRQQLEKKQRVPLVVHSHGALIAKVALEKLKPEERADLDVYAFGGVVMLPKSLAHTVRNFVNKGDIISRAANDKFDPQGILARIVKVTERSLLNEISVEEALFEQFQEDLYGEYQSGQDKIPEFCATFWSGNQETVKADDRFHAYASALRDYDITLLSGPKKISVKPTSLSVVTPEMKQSIAAYGPTVDQLFHKIFTFKAVLEDLAKGL